MEARRVAAAPVAASTFDREPPPPPRRRLPVSTAVLLLLLFALAIAFQQLAWSPSADSVAGTAGKLLGPDGGPAQAGKLRWQAALASLSSSRRRYVIIDAKNGLGNRLRAVASAMAVARALSRPVMVIWVPDLHLNCSFSRLFAPPLPFTLLEEEIPRANLSDSIFQVFNYMRPEPGAIKDELVDPDPDRHLFFRSAFVMNHPAGEWASGGPQRVLQRLMPIPEVQRQLIADRTMVGLHIRNVFDAPRDATSNVSTEGTSAMEGARREYGQDGTRKLLQWRRASHWTNFVPKIIELMREHKEIQEGNLSRPLQFYLAADSMEAYQFLMKRFPKNMLVTNRDCTSTRCDFRDCQSMVYSLVDMMNLARTRLILGSGYSSYSEIAAQMGGSHGAALPILMAGRDFGTIVERRRERTIMLSSFNEFDSVDLTGLRQKAAEVEMVDFAPRYWPCPF